LYAYDKEKNINLDSYIKVIQTYSKDKPVLKMQFMDKLNKLIISDGIQNNELPLFYETLKVAFPDIKIK
jgi:hypothetical protein